ncbi:MAG TPA: polyphosphate kinase 2 family protein, partial [Acidimicrobiales bacterium]
MASYEVTSGKGFRLADHDPDDTSDIAGGKAEGRAAVAALTNRLDALQELFYADGRFGLLVVLQGMDTSGKGGAIRKVFEGVNPTGVLVASFKPPTEIELAHDF